MQLYMNMKYKCNRAEETDTSEGNINVHKFVISNKPQKSKNLKRAIKCITRKGN